jgi:hypothetical protein
MQTPDAISDDEEEPTLLSQPIISTPSQHALGKRRRSTASVSDIERNDEIPLPFMQVCEDPVLLWIPTTALKRHNGRS